MWSVLSARLEGDEGSVKFYSVSNPFLTVVRRFTLFFFTYMGLLVKMTK